MRTCRRTISRSFLSCGLPALALVAGCMGGPAPDEVASEGLKAAPNVQERLDPAGLIESVSTNAFSAGATNGFFANLGTNGRTCNSCHVVEDGWTITPGHARALASNDPLFTPNDGSDCPPTSATQGPKKALSTELVNYGLIRVGIGIPSTANFSLVSATNPERCALPPGSAGAGSQLFLFRRPLPSTNLVFDATIMWDGRETLQKVTNAAGFQNEAPWLFDLSDQANSATLGHAQGASIAGTPAQADIVAFETNLYTAQSNLAFVQPLDVKGAHGGAQYLADTVAPAFAVGVNDPLQPGFTQRRLHASSRPGSRGAPATLRSTRCRDAIGRGEAIFNQTTFVIHDVPGLNSAPEQPALQPGRSAAGQDIRGRLRRLPQLTECRQSLDQLADQHRGDAGAAGEQRRLGQQSARRGAPPRLHAHQRHRRA